VRPPRLVVGAALAVALAAPACRENVTAPGSCPGICPSGQIRVVDTTLTGIVASDTSFVGYVGAREATFLVASTGDALHAVALVKFGTRDSTWYPTGSDTAVHVGQMDSTKITVTVTSRDTLAHDIWLLAYRLPGLFDTSLTRADVQPFLVDSLLVDSIAIPDTLKSGLVAKVIHNGRLDSIPAGDSSVVSLAFVARASGAVTVSLASSEEIAGAPRLYWYVHARAPRTTDSTVLSTGPQFDSFVYDAVAPSPATALLAGGLPSARALIRFQLPAAATDSIGLVRATLILTPTAPARGLPNEHFRLSARGLVRDFGAKSVVFVDTSAGGTAPIVAGDSGQINIEVARLLRVWGTVSGDSLPKALMLMGAPEGGGMGSVTIARGGSGATAPRLRITYIRPYEFGVP
jgi:hypothetical protein